VPRSTTNDPAGATAKKPDASDSVDKSDRTPKSDKQGTDKAKPEKKKTRVRDLPARFIARTPWLRRRYAKRLVRTVDKYKRKGRPLPENLARLERHLRTIPEPRRAKVVEEMMETSAEQEQATPSRAMRRAVGRQDRHKGGKGGGLRPGTLPGQPRQRTR
jgi:hypothetical protein